MNLMANLSWDELKAYLEHDDRVILPIGATEAHGRHLGLGTDSIEAEAIAEAVSTATHVAVAPPLNYGQSLALMEFSGTMSLRPTTLMAVLEDLLRSLYKHGFKRILIVNGHGGNTASVHDTVQTISSELPGLRVKNFDWWTDPESYRIVTETMGEQAGSHASAGETAFMMAVRPSAVKLKRLTSNNAPVQPSRELTTVQTFAGKYPDSIMGLDPSNATKEAGEKLLTKCVEICKRELDDWT